MKQPQDNKTLELELDGKRGRGRPPKADALTPAERAKRYRDNQRAIKAKVRANMAGDITEMREAEADLVKRVHELAAQLRQAHQTIDGLRKEQELLIQERTNAFKAFEETCTENENLAATIKRINQARATEVATVHQAYDEMHAMFKQASADKHTIVEQGAADRERLIKLEETLKRRDKTIKQLRDELKRHA